MTAAVWQAPGFTAGLVFNFNQDLRNSKLIPTWGSSVSVQIMAWQGLNDASKSYGQFKANLAVYIRVSMPGQPWFLPTG